MEDGDSSHGLLKYGLAQQFKEQNWILNYNHPPQSPDLNPQEGIWNILKQRAFARVWRTIDELKIVLQEEWARITIKDVRKRILEMPERCDELVRNEGGPIKSTVW